MTEFAAAITIFICCLILPLVNLAAVPMRYIIAFGMVSDMTQKFSCAEKRSQAVALALQPTSYQEFAKQFGISMRECSVSILCKSQNAESLILPECKPIPMTWLPGSKRGQINYFLKTETNVEIPPFVCIGPKVAGITAPIKMKLTATAPWENLGCDPATQEFYLNE